MTWLITSDIHLSDRPKDEYRFKLFRWLANKQDEHQTSALFILGDITENKDKHSSALVNRTIDELKLLRPPVYILRGNHDGNDPSNPFFRFLANFEGIHFIISPEVIDVPGGGHVAMIPHCRNQSEFDEACKIIPPKCTGVMLHNTFEGAIAETGAHLSGLRASKAAFKGAAAVWAGDVHKPQQVGPITYVGSPYHVRFGDRFLPRVLLVNGDRSEDLRMKAPRKWSLEVNDARDILNDERLREGDQLKIKVHLAREELVEWIQHRKAVLAACAERGLEVYDIALQAPDAKKRADVHTDKPPLSQLEVFEAYCSREKLPSAVRKAGRTILDEHQNGLDG